MIKESDEKSLFLLWILKIELTKRWGGGGYNGDIRKKEENMNEKKKHKIMLGIEVILLCMIVAILGTNAASSNPPSNWGSHNVIIPCNSRVLLCF